MHMCPFIMVSSKMVTSEPGGFILEGKSKLAPPGIESRPVKLVFRWPRSERPPPLTWKVGSITRAEIETLARGKWN
jgi:hypothetical protein